jgi:hypothetical protein
MTGMFLLKAVVVFSVLLLLSPVAAFFGPAVEVSKLRVSIMVMFIGSQSSFAGYLLSGFI